MKKILLIGLICFGTAQLFSMGPTWNMISLLKVPNDKEWEIGLRYFYLPDSIKLISGLDTIKIIPSQQRSHNEYEPDTIFTKQKYNLSLLPQRGKIIAIFYSQLDRARSIDSVIYGDLPNAICPSLGGTRTFHHQQINYLTRNLWLSEEGKEPTYGFTWKGTVYNANKQPLKNSKIFASSTSAYYDQFGVRNEIYTDENGAFTCHARDFIYETGIRYKDNLFEISRLDFTAKIGDTITVDIYLKMYVDQNEQIATTPLSILINNNTATIKYETNTAAHLAIYTANGQCVASKEISPSTGMQLWEITDLPKGVLVCVMHASSGEIVSQRFVIK